MLKNTHVDLGNFIHDLEKYFKFKRERNYDALAIMKMMLSRLEQELEPPIRVHDAEQSEDGELLEGGDKAGRSRRGEAKSIRSKAAANGEDNTDSNNRRRERAESAKQENSQQHKAGKSVQRSGASLIKKTNQELAKDADSEEDIFPAEPDDADQESEAHEADVVEDAFPAI